MTRHDDWRVELLDRDGTLKQPLPRVKGGSLKWSIFRSVQGTGSINWDHDPGVEIDWFHDQIRISHVTPQQVTPLGVWTITMPGWEHDATGTHVTIALADRTELLNTPVGRWFTVPAGTTITEQVIAIIREHGVTKLAVTPSPITTRVAQTWEPGDTWLKVCNDLLKACGYNSLWADMNGRVHIDPYRLPAERPTVATYGPADEHLRMLPTWGDEADVFSLPTGVRIFVPGTDQKAGLIGRADLPDHSPLSAEKRGRTILLTEQGEAATQAVADSLAVKRLNEALQVTRRISITHPMDETRLTDVVMHQPAGVRAAIVEREIQLGVGAVVKSVIRHIYTGGELPWARP